MKRIQNLFIYAALGFTTLLSKAQHGITPKEPVLVVHIVVDQMRSDYLFRFRSQFTSDGFNKLIQGGTNFNYASYPYMFSQTPADYASISTGTTPNVHGITQYQYYNQKKYAFTNCIDDDVYFNVGGDREKHGSSAQNLLASTIGDELKVASNGKSKVFALSSTKQGAILLGGHSADGAYWISNTSGEWCSSNYYRGSLPLWLQKYNGKNIAELNINKEWNLLKNKSSYSNADIVSNKPSDKFPVNFAQYTYANQKYRILKSTPFANTMISDLAIQLIDEEKLGEDATPDYLVINYANNQSSRILTSPNALRMEDLYLRLDRDIASIISHVEKKYGTHKVVFILSGTQAAMNNTETLSKFNLPGKEFKSTRALALLNSYLMAVYGQGKWILEYNNQQIYFNHELIKKSNITLDAILTDAASFIEDVTGVAYAFTAPDLKNAKGAQSEIFREVQKIYYPGRSGDIFLVLEPGWKSKRDDDRYPGVACNNNIRVPLAFYGWKIAREKYNEQVTPLDIAPTLSYILGIPFPNQAKGKILPITKYNF